MNKTDKGSKPQRRWRSVILDTLNRGTARFYAILGISFPGRIMTGYRRAESRLFGSDRYTGQNRCGPRSAARRRLVEAAEASRVCRWIEWILRAMLDGPTACYGLFFGSCGFWGILLHFVAPFLLDSFSRDMGKVIFSAAMLLLAIPLILTKRTLAEALGNSPLCRRILVGFLGIPRDRLSRTGYTCPKVVYGLSCLMGIGAAVCTLFTSPWIIPAALLMIGIVGMVLAYPEAGVVLATLTLPTVWLDRRFMAAPVVLILLTWISLGVKILFLHRAIRFGLLDRIVLILCFLIPACGLTSAAVTPSTVWDVLCLTVCASIYFLIVNLMTSREYVRRCLTGVWISVAVVTVLAYIRSVPVENLMWLEGSRGGDAIIDGVQNAVDRLSSLWVEHSELYLVLVFSWLYAHLAHTKRLLKKILGVVFILLDLGLILMTNSVSALFCILAVSVLFLLMLGHKWLSASMIALPVVGCGVYWLQYLFPLSDSLQTILSRSRLYKSQLNESLWQMVLDYPAGIGVGDESFAAVYPAYASPDLGAVSDSGNLFFEVLLNYGWIGFVLMAAILFLFLQKGCTCLRHTAVSKDRAMILGGMTSVVGMMIFGTVRCFIVSPRVFFTVVLVVSLCSAYENIVFAESDVREIEWAGSACAEDRFYRSGDFKRVRPGADASTNQKE
ncbi:MAG: hypothetical protein E7610_07520 [Ruminococcaceae bacterium]|nr:hypothetical protein [Oscillospiraceae bacterium]